MPELAGFADPAPVLDTWCDWKLGLTGRPQLLERVPGGRTNRNYRLSAPGLSHDLLLRLNHLNPAQLGIDRDREYHILELTARAGIGRELAYWDPAQRFALFPYLEARTWTSADLARPEQRQRLWPLVEQLGQIALDCPRRRYHDYVHHYWCQLERRGLTDPRLRQAWRDFEPRLKVFDQANWSARLTHHDLIPANILDTGERLHIIDWEYAAPGHPAIDVWSLDPEAITEPFVPELMAWINGLWERLMGPNPG